MAVHCNVDVAFFKRPEVYHGGHPVADSEKTVGGNAGGYHTGKGEGQTAAEELLQDGAPVTVYAAA